MSRPTYRLRSPEKGKNQRTWETSSAVEAVNLRAAGWTDVDDELDAADAAEEPVPTKQRAPRNKARTTRNAAPDTGSSASSTSNEGTSAPSTNSTT